MNAPILNAPAIRAPISELARRNAETLAFIRDSAVELKAADIAKAFGRDKSNLSKALAGLEGEGLVSRTQGIVRLTETGADVTRRLQGGEDANAVREALDARGEARAGSTSDEHGFAAIAHALIVPDTLNPRTEFDDAALDELAGSIRADGLLQPLVVRPAAAMDGYGQPMHRLIAGERRWRAIRKLIVAGDWPAEKPVPCMVRDTDEAGHAIAAILENLQRRDLKPLEEARAFDRLIKQHGLTTATIAGRINASQRVVQQRLQLLELPEKEQGFVDAGKWTIEEARRFLANRPKPLEFTDDARLMFLEIAHRFAASASGDERPSIYADLPIGAPDEDDPALTLLADTLWLVRVAPDYSTAQWELTGQYQFKRALAQLTGTDEFDREKIEAALGGAPTTYRTAWLNEPYAVDPERLKEIEERRRASAESDQRHAAEKAQAEDLKAQTKALEKTLRKGAPPPESGDVRQLAEGVGVRFPVSVKNDNLVDAADRVLATLGYSNGLSPHLRGGFLRLTALALNAAAGFASTADARPAQAAAGEGGEPELFAAPDAPTIAAGLAEAMGGPIATDAEIERRRDAEPGPVKGVRSFSDQLREVIEDAE